MNDSIAILGMAPPPGSGGRAESPGTVYWVGMMGIMMAIIYMMIIRPQRRRETQRKQLLGSVKTGDRVVFGGGVLGTVTNVKERTFIVRVAEKVKMEVLRGAVTHVVQKGELPEDDPNA